MKEIITWLASIERRAEEFYKSAAITFKSNDHELSSLLSRLALEESEHLKCMEQITEFMEDRDEPKCAIELDNETKEKIEGYFRDLSESLKAGELTSKKMMELIVNAEFSEWNDIFLYAVKIVKESPNKECTSSIVSMQRHKDQIREFIETRNEYKAFLKTIKEIPDIWNESILIVDDEPIILDILENVLVEDKLIEKAVNGEEALKKLDEKNFAAIISDIRMPVMDGLEFYKKAVEKFPDIGKRFIFFSASSDTETLKFISENNITLLNKPAPIGKIKKVVRETIDKANA